MWPSKIDLTPLNANHRAALALHWLSLSADDRYARFGAVMDDESLMHLSRSMDWKNTHWLGAWLHEDMGLVGVLQLSPTNHDQVWELALTVHEQLREHGIASLLLTNALCQMPKNTRLICHHGHAAIVRIATRLGINIEVSEI